MLMKRLSLLFFMFFLPLSGFSQTKSIVGKWVMFDVTKTLSVLSDDQYNWFRYVDLESEGSIEFKKDFILLISDGKEEIARGTYKIYATHKPIWVDIP